MSELKVHRFITTDELFPEANARALYYLKSEADKVIAEKDKEIAELKEERRWRKFSDEKPNEDTWCIVFHEGEIDTDHYMRFTYNKKCDFALYGNKVTHWMPLPSAPKEEK